jgi:hypothetical protein
VLPSLSNCSRCSLLAWTIRLCSYHIGHGPLFFISLMSYTWYRKNIYIQLHCVSLSILQNKICHVHVPYTMPIYNSLKKTRNIQQSKKHKFQLLLMIYCIYVFFLPVISKGKKQSADLWPVEHIR